MIYIIYNFFKKRYEDEILRLRRQLELQGNSNSNNGNIYFFIKIE